MFLAPVVILVVCLGLALVAFGLWTLLPAKPLPSVGRLPGEAPQRPGWALIAVSWILITAVSALVGLMLSFGAYMLVNLILFLIFWTPLSSREEWLMAIASFSAGSMVFGLSATLGQLAVVGKYVGDIRPTLGVALVATALSILQGLAGGALSQEVQFATLTVGAALITAALSVSTWVQLLRAAPSPSP